MKKLLVIFEDERHGNFASLSLLRPTYFLRSGMTELWVHLKRSFPGYDLRFEARPHLAYPVKRHSGLPVNDFNFHDYDRVALVNGTLIPDEEFLDQIEACDSETAFVSDSVVGAFVIAGDSDCAREYAQIKHQPGKYTPFASSLKHVTDYTFKSYRYIWDLMQHSPDNIRRDFALAVSESGAPAGANQAGRLDGSHVIAPEDVFVHPEAEIGPTVVIDASQGPVYIGRDAIVEPHSYVRGPFYLADGASLLGGRFSGSSVGPVCQVGGELEECVLQGYVNKHHAGFIGHSYVGEWVNFGAMTTNSDLKNNYSTVRVSVGGQLIDSGQTKVGAFIGDHTKFGIGTLLNTGLNIGVFCNIFGGSLVSDKEVASFSWGSSGSWSEHAIDKALETARRALSRRGCELSSEDEKLIRLLRGSTKR